MASPDKADFRNQHDARVSWDDSKRQSSKRRTYFNRFRGSRIARRIILYNIFSLSFLMVAFLVLIQNQGVTFASKQERLRLSTDLVVALLNQTELETVSTGYEVRLFQDGEAKVLEMYPTVEIGVGGVLGFARSFTQLFSPISEEELRANFETVLANVARSTAEFPQVLSVDDRSSSHTIMVERAQVGEPDAQTILVVSSQLGALDREVALQRERFVRAFLSSIAVAIGLSIILAYSIATPIHELADAAEAVRDTGGSPNAAKRIKIPNLDGRPDEIGRLSLAMRDMTKSLYEQIEHNQRFAADVTHEIKNPLASVSSAAQSLGRVQDPEQRRNLEQVLLDDVNRMDRLITDISQASKLDADLVRAERASFDLGNLLNQIVSFHKMEAEDKGITLHFTLPEPQLFYIGLEQRLAQVFSNLISNAVSICDDGDEVTVWNFQTGDKVFAIVEDTGPGIPEENLESIFERFYSSRAESFGKNSGLGLAISKQIVEGHQGQIWAENIYANDDPNSQRLGARFVVSLPRV